MKYPQNGLYLKKELTLIKKINFLKHIMLYVKLVNLVLQIMKHL